MSLLRALVSCEWFGIQTWIGGQAVFQLVNALLRGGMEGPGVPGLGMSAGEFACFLAFWGLQVGVIWNGIWSIRELEKLGAPILIVLSGVLIARAYIRAGGFGPMLSLPSQFFPGDPKVGQFWQTFSPALTANIGFWVTLSLSSSQSLKLVEIMEVSSRRSVKGNAIAGSVGTPSTSTPDDPIPSPHPVWEDEPWNFPTMRLHSPSLSPTSPALLHFTPKSSNLHRHMYPKRTCPSWPRAARA